MTNESAFPEQVCRWALSRQFQCSIVREPGFVFPRIDIAFEGRQPVEVIPVSLTAWERHGAAGLIAELDGRISERRAAGQNAVVLWEDYWLGKNAIVKSRLAAMLGHSAKIPARLTQVRRVDTVTANNFLEANHLNGVVSSKFRYGLFLPNRYYRVLPGDFPIDRSTGELLVAVATFSNARIFEQNGAPFRSHELIRFAGLLNTNVVGGLDKLLRAFARDKAPGDIMTYADTEWSDGRSYAKLGFEKRGVVAPREVLLDTHHMLRLSARSNPPVDYLTVYNLGSIKYVLVTETAANEP